MPPVRLLAISSSGGHWVQLRAIADNLEAEVVYATTGMPAGAPRAPVHIVPDANRNSPLQLLRSAWQVAGLLRRVRPSHIISTGAAPGCLAVIFGRVLGKSVVFVDSIANAEEVSVSGRLAARLGVLTLTQWPHLATGGRIRYAGNVFGELG